MSSSNETGRSIDADDLVPKLLQMARQPPLATADVNRPPSRARYDLQELIPMKAPVAIVPRGAGPGDPLIGMCFPACAQVHGTISLAGADGSLDQGKAPTQKSTRMRTLIAPRDQPGAVAGGESERGVFMVEWLKRELLAGNRVRAPEA
jgi:hypothetical protein